MNILELMLLPLFAVVLLILPVVYALKKKKSNGAAKTAFIVNLCSFLQYLHWRQYFQSADLSALKLQKQ